MYILKDSRAAADDDDADDDDAAAGSRRAATARAAGREVEEAEEEVVDEEEEEAVARGPVERTVERCMVSVCVSVCVCLCVQLRFRILWAEIRRRGVVRRARCTQCASLIPSTLLPVAASLCCPACSITAVFFPPMSQRRVAVLQKHLASTSPRPAAATATCASCSSHSSSSTTTTMSRFAAVPVAPPDAILGLNAAFKADKNASKVNLGVGAYRTEEGEPYVLPVVNRVERAMAADASVNKEYCPIEGVPEFRAVTAHVVLGKENAALKENRVSEKRDDEEQGRALVWCCDQGRDVGVFGVLCVCVHACMRVCVCWSSTGVCSDA